MAFTVERPVNTVVWLEDKGLVSFGLDDTEKACREAAVTNESVEGSSGGIGAYRALRAFAEDILKSSDFDKLLDRCGRLVQRLLRADACSIALLDEQSGRLVPLLTMGSGRMTTGPALPFELLDGRMRDAIYAGRPLVVAHELVIDGAAPLPLLEMQSALAAMLLPMPLEQGQRGVFWVARIHGQTFTPEEQELAETLSALVALSVLATTLAKQ